MSPEQFTYIYAFSRKKCDSRPFNLMRKSICLCGTLIVLITYLRILSAYVMSNTETSKNTSVEFSHKAVTP